jgi:hypothetical protein
MTFKSYRILWPNNQDGRYHETKSLIVVVSPSFQNIENELNGFHPYETCFISFFISTVNIVSCHHQIWFGMIINVMKPPLWMTLYVIVIFPYKFYSKIGHRWCNFCNKAISSSTRSRMQKGRGMRSWAYMSGTTKVEEFIEEVGCG